MHEEYRIIYIDNSRNLAITTIQYTYEDMCKLLVNIMQSTDYYKRQPDKMPIVIKNGEYMAVEPQYEVCSVEVKSRSA